MAFSHSQSSNFSISSVRHAFDQLEDAVTTSALSDSDIDDVSLNVVKKPGCKTFLNDHRASSVLITQEMRHHSRPHQRISFAPTTVCKQR